MECLAVLGTKLRRYKEILMLVVLGKKLQCCLGIQTPLKLSLMFTESLLGL